MQLAQCKKCSRNPRYSLCSILRVDEIDYCILSNKQPGQYFQLIPKQAAKPPTSDTTPADFKHGHYIAVVYDDKWYPGVIEAIHSKMLQVHFMEKAGLTENFSG